MDALMVSFQITFSFDWRLVLYLETKGALRRKGSTRCANECKSDYKCKGEIRVVNTNQYATTSVSTIKMLKCVIYCPAAITKCHTMLSPRLKSELGHKSPFASPYNCFFV